MSESLSLFEPVEVAPPAKSSPVLELPLAHPYSRYGLAVALFSSDLPVELKLEPEKIDEATLRECLAFALESGLGDFRMQTLNDPQLERELTFHSIPLEVLKDQPTLVQSAGLAARGIYIYPTVVTTDGDAKGTFENVTAIIKALRGNDASNSSRKYSRSFAPTTAKINNGTASQSEPKGTLIETACAAITTLTPLKPAAWAERNTVIIPDLPLLELIRFIEVFQKMIISELGKDLKVAKLPPLETKTNTGKAKTKAKADAKPKSEYRRPKLHNGNYPFAPRDANAFGAVGLLAAIGRWASSSEYVERAHAALESLSDAPLYIISYDKITQARFKNHVVKLAKEARLSEMLDALWQNTKLYADIDSPRISHQAPAYQLFYFQTNRFLQSFSLPAFRDFLAARAEYPPELGPLFQEFFLTQMKIEPEALKEIVKSAGELGQWLNRTAFFVADAEYETGATDRINKVRKAKAKILVEFESAAMSAKSPQDLLFRISTRAGRLLQDDAPAGAKRFMDAVASGEITQQDAVHLLIAYMRLRAPRKETGEPTRPAEVESEAIVPQPIED